MVVTRIQVRYIVGFLSFLILMLVLGVLARPAEAQMQGSADLSVQKFDFPPNQVNVGEPLFYELNVANSTGSDTATNAVIQDNLPSNTEFLFTISGNCSNAGQTVTCNLGDLAPGELAVAEFAVCPVSPGTVTNTATASSGTPDPDNSNNTATETTEVVGPDVGGCTTQEPPPTQEPPAPPQEPTPPNDPQPKPGPVPQTGPGPAPQPAPQQLEASGNPGLCAPSGILVVNEQNFSLVCVGRQVIVTRGNVPGKFPIGNEPVNGGTGGITVQNLGDSLTVDGVGIGVQNPNNPMVTVNNRRVFVGEQ